MSASSRQPELIISLSHDKVTFDLAGRPEEGTDNWRSSFSVDALFREDQIAESIDKMLIENSTLMEDLPCVDVVVIDRPHLPLPAFYSGLKAAEIASGYLRLRFGDIFNRDNTAGNYSVCYTIPEETSKMLREYYAKSRITHLTSLIWHALRAHAATSAGSTGYFVMIQDVLLMIASRNGKMTFSKVFTLRDEADLFYYSIACSQMLAPDYHCFVTIEHEVSSFELPDNSILKVDQHLSLPSLRRLIEEYQPCES